MTRRPPDRAAGFTMAELLVVVVVVTLFIGALFVPVTGYIQNARVTATQRSLDLIRDRLLEFVVRNGRLPCPADPESPTGTEWRDIDGRCAGMPGTSIVATGVIPWAVLQVAEADAWGVRFTYSVDSTWADSSVNAGCIARERFVSFCATPAPPAPPAPPIVVESRGQAGVARTQVATHLAAVVLSHGPNGNGGYAQGGAARPLPAGADESQNRLVKPTAALVDPRELFVARDPTPGTAGCDDAAGPAPCAFDDRLVMLGRAQIIARMLAEGQLQ